MRISDWSSDVCSSDLPAILALCGSPDAASIRRKKDLCGVLTVSRLAPALPTSGGGCRDTQQGRRRGTSLSFLRAVDTARCVLHSCRFGREQHAAFETNERSGESRWGKEGESTG